MSSSRRRRPGDPTDGPCYLRFRDGVKARTRWLGGSPVLCARSLTAAVRRRTTLHGMRRVDELAAATPKTRDRYVDFLRAVSIAAVVFGHWFIGVIHLESGLVYLTSAVGLSSGLWLGTWLFQVMPIFFFVGGFSNLTAYESFRRRGETTGTFVRIRLERLLRPSLLFLGAWTGVQVGLHLADVGTPAGPVLWGGTTLLRGV